MKDSNNDKDVENKRPPWRAVSLSTLPKPDKNALLRAKLLDASRRLRAGKASVAVQTDIIPTKLMKEVKLGPQTDLILYKEIGILTDGSYTKKKEGSDEFILTYSVSQMTDAVSVTNVSTQTLLPKVAGDDFMDAYYNCDRNAINRNEFTDIERKLLEQVCQLREREKPSMQQETHEETKSNIETVGIDGSDTESDTDTSATVKSYCTQNPPENASSKLNARPSLLKPTLSSWNFEYDEIDGVSTNNFGPYIISANRPWSSFTPFPFPARKDYIGYANLNWNLLLVSIDELILESNRLVDIIEGAISRKMERHRGIFNGNQKLNQFKPQIIELPSEYWLPIIDQQEKELDKMVKNLKDPTVRNQK